MISATLEHGMARAVLRVLPGIIAGIKDDLSVARPKCRALLYYGPIERPQGAPRRIKTVWTGSKTIVDTCPVTQALASHRAWLLRLAGSEDTLQDACVQVLEHGAQDRPEALRLLAMACKRRKLNDLRATERFQKYLEQAAILQVPRNSPEAVAVREAVKALRRPDQQLVRAVYWSGMSVSEYAQTVGQSRATIAMRLSRVRDKLAVILTE